MVAEKVVTASAAAVDDGAPYGRDGVETVAYMAAQTAGEASAATATAGGRGLPGRKEMTKEKVGRLWTFPGSR